LNCDPENRELLTAALPLKRAFDMAALPNAEFPKRAPPKTEFPDKLLRAAKFEAAREGEIEEFDALPYLDIADRIPDAELRE
jgi:hypothetical protein